MNDLWPESRSPFSVLWNEANGKKPGSDPEPDSAYEHRPIDWMVERLGIPRSSLVWSENEGYQGHKWDGTVDPLVRMAQAIADWKDAGAESGTGTGKSFFVAALILWFLGCFRGARIFTFAPKEDQLRLYIWTEIGKMWPRFKAIFPTAELTDLRIRMNAGADDEDAWGAVGYAVGIRAGEVVSTKAAGMHAEHLLLVYEETPGIHKAVLEAGANTCTAPHNLRIAVGNPDNQADALRGFCKTEGVVSVRISALDHPNVVTGEQNIPGAVSRGSIAKRLARYKNEDHPLYRSRVRGISPTESAEALIRRVWCEEAAQRYTLASLREGKPALGVDVANSEDGDRGAIARWLGACLTEVVSFPCPDALQLGIRVHTEAKAAGIDPRHVGVDSVGVGAATVNKLKELQYRVQSLNGGAKALATVDEDVRYPAGHKEGPTVVEEEQFYNLRSQMWWQMRLDLERGKIALPPDSELFDDLTQPSWWPHNGKIHVESKEDIRERLGRSPDKGDAAVYGNWVRFRRLTTPAPKVPIDRNRDTGLEKILALKNRMNNRNHRVQR
jgi:phage terminase large subunit